MSSEARGGEEGASPFSLSSSFLLSTDTDAFRPAERIEVLIVAEKSCFALFPSSFQGHLVERTEKRKRLLTSCLAGPPLPLPQHYLLPPSQVVVEEGREMGGGRSWERDSGGQVGLKECSGGRRFPFLLQFLLLFLCRRLAVPSTLHLSLSPSSSKRKRDSSASLLSLVGGRSLSKAAAARVPRKERSSSLSCTPKVLLRPCYSLSAQADAPPYVLLPLFTLPEGGCKEDEGAPASSPSPRRLHSLPLAGREPVHPSRPSEGRLRLR
jgi:hypothetical protein